MKWYGLLAALLGISPSWAGEPRAVTVTHFETLQKLDLENAASATQQKLRQPAPLNLSFDAHGRSFELELQPNDRLLSASRGSLPDGIALYRGRLAGNANSWTRIVLADGQPQGLIWDGQQMFVIEAPGDSAVAAGSPVVYRLADAFVTPGMMSCGASGGSASAAAMYSKLVGELEAAKLAAGATLEIRLSAIGDFEFFDREGAGAEAAIAARLNNVDGIFSEQLGVQITVDTLEVHTDADDPFSDTLDSEVLLDELSEYRRISPVHNGHGLTHLYTGRDLDGTTVGIAYTNALCSLRYGAGLTESRNGLNFDSLVAAHEIGHNFGAPHDAEADSACEAETEDFLMAPSLNGSNQFSACSIAQMQPRIAAAACITALPVVDMTISLNGSLEDVSLGDEVELAFDVRNVGSEPAANVEVEVFMPDKLTLVSAVASSGDCSSGAGSVNCQLDTIAGGSIGTVTILATATDTGSADVVARVSADNDDNPDNNEESFEVQVAAAVDLVVDALAATQVDINQSTSISADLENRSIFDATAVEMSISFDAGLEAQAASWPLGACTVMAQQVDCETDNFAAQSAATLDITLVGTTAGARSYTVSLSSMETDADSSNNSASGTVTVIAVSADTSSDGEGGGGGAMNLYLLLLTWATLCARWRLTAANPRSARRRY